MFWNDLEQALGTVLTKAIHFGLSAGISRKFLRDAHEHVINSGCTLKISRKFLREDMARKCIYPTTGPTRMPSRLANHVF